MTTRKAPLTKEQINAQQQLFDTIKADFELKNYEEVAKFLRIPPPALSQYRHSRRIGAMLLVRIHETTDWSIREIRDMLGHGTELYQGE